MMKGATIKGFGFSVLAACAVIGVMVQAATYDVRDFGAKSDGQNMAAKGGLMRLARSLARAGAPHGVRAFCVASGPVLTSPEMAKMQTLLGTASQPQEVVDFILFMASDCCPSVTGTTHVIACGRLSMGRQATAVAEKKG